MCFSSEGSFLLQSDESALGGEGVGILVELLKAPSILRKTLMSPFIEFYSK